MNSNQFPPAIQGKYANHRPNVDIPISNEPVRIIGNGNTIPGTAKVSARFLPTPRLVIDATFENVLTPLPDSPFTVEFPNLNVSTRGFFSKVEVKLSNSSPSAQGEILLYKEPIEINLASNLSSIVFHLVNFNDFFGITLNHASEPNAFTRGSRVILVGDGWKITIDSTPLTKENIEELGKVSGFAITHVGKMEREDGAAFTLEGGKKFLDSLMYFLSFVRGAWVSPVLSIGYDSSGAEIWQEWGVARRITPWRFFYSCFDIRHADLMLPLLFSGFMARSHDHVWSEDIYHAIYWYVESNAYHGGQDAALILSQAALELLSWDYLVNEKRNLSKNGFERIPASDQIRLLISQCGIPLTLPAALGNLGRFAKSRNLDGPEAVTTIRNIMVHPGKKRTTSSPDSMEIFEAHHLALWYVELVVLRLFDYKGDYANRVSGARWVGQVERVPWAT